MAFDDDTSDEEDNADDFDPVEGFRRGWEDMIHGRVLTEEEFWQSMQEDDAIAHTS